VILSGQNIYKSYSGRPTLRNCSLSVASGQCLILRGPSGGGKSTLLRILALLEQADSGSVLHDDRRWEATQKHEVSPYPFLTMVFQQLFLWPNLTMAQNLSIVLTNHPKSPLSKTAMEMLERFSITGLLDRRPHECSLGERQRLAVARSLLSDARFLLLDEPSSALDTTNREVLIRELKGAMSRDRGVFLVTHDERGYNAIADECFELEDGQIQKL